MIRLKIEREKRGLTQGELELTSGVNRVLISLIERRRFRPYRSQIERLASALECFTDEPERLLEEVG